MGKAFQRLIATGVIPRWDREGNWLTYADRVQDRVRIISDTKFAKKDATAKTLSMNGKIITIFLLWLFCLATCCASLAFEMVRGCVKEFRNEVSETRSLKYYWNENILIKALDSSSLFYRRSQVGNYT